MATTILKHIKTSKEGNPHSHLFHAIRYIMNPEKTEDRLWIGSNCGETPVEIIDAMLDTKEEFGKLYGRQGYHFVISFAPGEATEEQAYAVGKEFCKRYLDAYDHCFAVHNDHAHMHVHIIFNSVDRFGGYKYQYHNGDWEKTIQPLVDEICIKNDLSPLSYDKDAKRKGVSYAEWEAEKEGRLTRKDIIRMDIDHAIREAENEEDFFEKMRGMGYAVRKGHSERLGQDYVAYTMPGAEKARRDYNLGKGYSLPEVLYRIEHKELEDERKAPFLMPDEELHVYKMSELNRYQICAVVRYKQAIGIYIYNLSESDQARVREDLLKINELRRECNYLLDNGIGSVEELNDRLRVVKDDLKEINAEIKTYDSEVLKERKESLIQEKKLLSRLIKEAEVTLSVDTDAREKDMTVIPVATSGSIKERI